MELQSFSSRSSSSSPLKGLLQREDSNCSLESLCLLENSPDQKEFIDSCYSDDAHYAFDPPAWRPGRFLQFADIVTPEDESSVRPVSLVPAERLLGSRGAGRWSSLGGEELVPPNSVERGSLMLEIGTGPSTASALCWRPSVATSFSRRTALVVTSSMAVALTALTLLSFVLF